MNPPKTRLGNLRCVECGKGPIEKTAKAFRCSFCCTQIDSIAGVPFIGNYESSDLLGLIEIAAVKERGSTINSAAVDRIEKLCQGYYEAGESGEWLSAQEDAFAQAYWFPYRYSEWRDFRLISEGIGWEGSRLLDVGAGVGYDAIRYLRLGSDVTALEYNPASIARGLLSVPEAHWVGGFSHLLPFRDEEFDVICVNAALHHMRDVKQAFREMFRALKPGGTILTSGDPFRSSGSNEADELAIFDSHPAVLKGINEGIPNIEVFLEPLQEFGEAVTGFVITHSLQSSPVDVSSVDLGRGYRRWTLKDLPALAGCWGSIALHLRKTKNVAVNASIQRNYAIRAGAYHDAVSDLSETMGLICPVLPNHTINRPVVPDSQSWFDLLNGWKSPVSGERWRRGFGRGRWFLEKEGGFKGVKFDLGWHGQETAQFEFLLNGRSVEKIEVASGTRLPLTRLLASLHETFASVGPLARMVRWLEGIRDSSEPFHPVTLMVHPPIEGRFVLEIRNLNESFPDYTVGNRILI